ncbi:MAG: serine hydrolase [Saprospiraceae bacterium]|nr:serine hydrolase [Saprospiraceae bacterium]
MKTTFAIRFCIMALLAVTLSSGVSAQDLKAQFDKIISESFPGDGPGCTAIVAKGDQVLYRTAVGMANIELEVPMKTDHVFRIGSITKQFTAAAILRLEEEGKLSVQDDITKYLPDYPTQGRRITVEHLLTHTSGIRSYTDMPEFGAATRIDKSPTEFLSFFQDQPMDFAPGDKWQYNNSGYFLLGVIIEKISGKPYGDYIEETFFQPLGMKNSHYGHNQPIVKGRAAGYDKNDNGYVNSDFLSMDLPYAAGSLLSTVDDLYTWYKAVMTGKVLKPQSLAKAHSPFKLNNGKMTTYGYGWSLGEIQGSRVIEHGGGINGFLSASLYLPEEKVFVAVLSNSTGNPPDLAARKIAALAIGKPLEWKKIDMPAEQLTAYVGNFELEDEGELRLITLENGQLYSQRGGRSKLPIHPYAKDKFFFENSISQLEFRRDAKGAVQSVILKDQSGPTVWNKTDKKPTERTAITLAPEVLQEYVGEYPIQSSFVLRFMLEDGQLMTQATGQPKFPIFAERKDFFFLKVVDAQVEFVRDAGGKVEKLILHQGGQQIPAMKKK